jgi:hypothetical protein
MQKHQLNSEQVEEIRQAFLCYDKVKLSKKKD